MSQGLHRPVSLLLLSLTLGAGGAAGAAETSRQALPAPDVFVSVCGGLAHGSVVRPGDAIGFTLAHQCQSSLSLAPSLPAPLSAQAGFVAPHVQAEAAGEARYGWASGSAAWTGSNALNFPAAFSTFGWEDLLQVDGSGLSGTGLLKVRVRVQGVLQADPVGNTGARFTLRGYGGFALGDLAKEQVSWGGQGQAFFPYDQAVDELVSVYIPFFYGQSFEMGLFGQIRVGAASMGFGVPAPPYGAGEVQITRMSWEGIETVYRSVWLGYTAWVPVDPALISLHSGTGIDWMQAVGAPVPEPRAAWLLAAGLLLLHRRRRLPD